MVRAGKRRPGCRTTAGERVFYAANTMLMVLLMVAMLYPFWHIVMYSLSDPALSATGGAFLVPRGFTLDSYKFVFSYNSVGNGFKVSLFVTIVGTALSVFCTAALAYSLSKRKLRGRNFLTMLIFFTMIFSGGMVPSFILVRQLKLFNTVWALILPGLMNAWNFFIARNFFASLPESLEESAKIDGATDLAVFFKIALPLSKAMLSVIGLFVAVGYWNDYFSTVLYIVDFDKWSLQATLRQLIGNTLQAMQQAGINYVNLEGVTSQSVIMTTIVVVTVPIIVVYPFLQKYFVKGVMVGSLKG
jgi:putative aldouronate transport system permease protein